MGLIDKFKNLFTEEVEEEVPIKKEVIQVEIPSPKEQKREKKERRVEKEETETLEELPVSEEPKFEPIREEIKEEYKFPFFDDEDFEEIEEKREEKKEKKKSLYRNKEMAYNPPKEEKHAFKPTPIISPVYGILDKNYVKEDIKSRNLKPSSYYNPKEATIDEIRNKAYGTLEDDVAHELYDGDRALYEPVDVLEEKDSEDLFVEMERETPATPEEEHVARHAKVSDERSDELTSLLEQEMSKEATENKPKEPAKISDKELFNLIDSMYERGDK